MDAATLAALAAALAALPINAFFILVIIILWRRVNVLTDRLIDCEKKIEEKPAEPTLPDDIQPSKMNGTRS